MIAAYRALLRISWTRIGAPLCAAIALLNLTANQGWKGGSASTAVAVVNSFGLALPLVLVAAGLDGLRERTTDSTLAAQRAARRPLAVHLLQFFASTTWTTLAYIAVVIGATVASSRDNPGTLPSSFALAIGYLGILSFTAVALAVGRHTPMLVGLIVNSALAYLVITYLAGEPESSAALFTIIDGTMGPPGVIINKVTGARQSVWFVALAGVALASLTRRFRVTRVLASTMVLILAGTILATGTQRRWVHLEDNAAISTCQGSVCVWKDHARVAREVVSVIHTLNSTARNGLPAPPTWQESVDARSDVATFYFGTARATVRDVGDAIAHGYLSWLSCGANLDPREAISREQWLSTRLVPSRAQDTLAHVSEIETWPEVRQWSWFTEILPKGCRLG
jgi:hypothetical protein